MAGRRREYSEGRTARWGGEEGLDLLRHDEWSAGSSALFLTALAAVSQGLSLIHIFLKGRLFFSADRGEVVQAFFNEESGGEVLSYWKL